MTPNRLKKLWAEGKPTINGWCSIGNSFVAEIMANQGYDSVTIDAQHGALDYSHILSMLQAMLASGTVPMVRVPWMEPGIIMKALDAGAYGIICPMVSTAAQAAEFVSYMRYPPLGQRSYGPTRVSFSAGSNYASEANDEILAFAMIETAQGMAELKEIATTPGLDGIYVGPADLTLGLTKGRLPAGFDREEPEIIVALQEIASVCRASGIRAGLHCATPEYAQRAVGWGFDMTTVASDVRLLSSSAGASVSKFRSLLAQPATMGKNAAY
ncbi:2,4-dihydroxyhept-2-ene-1,7-dioic acid aldolase [Mesorhizobium sp. M3A.F.Ca.ET.080.04.2.1]|uniref:HpcH/HpaI aldolase family protein n=1 Tax=Mesorhizobium sp. M3A.F.Ca.ET.080.04.2.1 TaxID=2493676 RepID=UPI000F756697|nr:aldolase/citrate lyase family protein [Mesorhizobium sp. M3A.F.Ca.ET.080.04.2.1]AZO07960.1 2,4-dihydroxyhept-2-ene-1,7-dioic acid aldolase [Mesorhizobium sp. M3A.F.Ca.ET.080.04.2.1]RWF13551.1 MAG: 2,4-dihydroxyhept-2-ene-1,7-dioic acid aldolase [Mesorhizobium sp.]